MFFLARKNGYKIDPNQELFAIGKMSYIICIILLLCIEAYDKFNI